MMKTFGFIVHPLSLNHYIKTLGNFGLIAERLPPYLFKRFLYNIPPYKFLHLKNIKSFTEEHIDGYIIMCPLTPDQIINGGDKAVKKIISACRLAKELGSQIIGLGGFTSIVGNGGEEVAAHINIPITSGNTFTASLVIDSLMSATKIMKIEKHSSTIAIVGATGDIGSICALILSKYFGRVICVARDKCKLNEFVKELNVINNADKAEASIDLRDSIKKSDVILTVTSALTTIIDHEDIRSGAVLCDVSYPANIDKNLAGKRDDILVFEGGLAKSECFHDLSDSNIKRILLFNPSGSIHGCLSETMLLTFEGRFENFSLGRGKISERKIQDINRMAIKHGFRHADLITPCKIID